MIDGLAHSRLVSFAATMVGRQDAEDVVQDVYVKFLNGDVPPFRGESERRTWVFSVVKYTAYCWRTRAERRRRAEETTCGVDATYTPDYDAVLDMRRHLAALSPRDQHVLRAYATHGTYRAAAEATGLTRAQVRNRLHRARRRLRERLA